jgi:hypothetical protein
LDRTASSYTDERGIIELFAPEGDLQVKVSLDAWQGSTEIEVLPGQDNEVHIHRKIDETVRVVGRVIGWPASNQSRTDQVAGLEVHVKAIDGESGDDFKVKTDEQGQFAVETTATMLGAIVFADDRRFAGTAVMKDLEAVAGGRSVGVPFQAIFEPSGKRITDSYGATGNIGYMSGFEGKRHFRKMMELACKRITEAEIESLLGSLED